MVKICVRVNSSLSNLEINSFRNLRAVEDEEYGFLVSCLSRV